jgi:hypothetical protein
MLCKTVRANRQRIGKDRGECESSALTCGVIAPSVLSIRPPRGNGERGFKLSSRFPAIGNAGQI